MYRLKAHEIPKKERTARGTAMLNLLQLQPGEHIQTIIDTRDYETNRFLFFATKKGQVKKTKFNEYDSSLRTGIIAINLRDGDELVKVIPTNGGDDIFMLSKLGQAIRFTEDDVRSMGRAAAGVRGMKLRAGDEVVSLDTCRDDVAMLIVTDAGYGKRTQLEHFNAQGRGGQGVRGIKLTAKKGFVVAAFMVGLDDEIFVINSAGTLIRMEVRGISSQGRDATGVRVMNLDDGRDGGLGGPGALRRRRRPPEPSSPLDFPHRLRARAARADDGGGRDATTNDGRSDRRSGHPAGAGRGGAGGGGAPGPGAAGPGRADERAQARTAADAAALAGAAEGEDAAREVAAANGAALIAWRADG